MQQVQDFYTIMSSRPPSTWPAILRASYKFSGTALKNIRKKCLKMVRFILYCTQTHLFYVHSQNFTSLTTLLFTERDAGEFVLHGEVCLTENNVAELLVWFDVTLIEQERNWMLSGNYYLDPLFAALTNLLDLLTNAIEGKQHIRFDFPVTMPQPFSQNGQHEKVDTAEAAEQRKSM
jgi:hypothetical protein